MTAVIGDRPTLRSLSQRRSCRSVIAQDISGRIVNHSLPADKIPDHVFADFARIDGTDLADGNYNPRAKGLYRDDGCYAARKEDAVAAGTKCAKQLCNGAIINETIM